LLGHDFYFSLLRQIYITDIVSPPDNPVKREWVKGGENKKIGAAFMATPNKLLF
jgi:hypothetical protein